MSPLDQVRQWPAGEPAAVVVGMAGVLDRTGPQRDYPWASVTKLITALVVLDAMQEGLVDLDEPAGPPGSTVRHLLAHASGLAPDADRVLAAPGRSRIYSNAGFEVLGRLVAERTGVPFPHRAQARVTGPLGMTGTRIDGSPAHGGRGPLDDLARLARELLAPQLLPVEQLRAATRPAFPGLAGVLPGFGRQDPNDWGLGFELRDGKSPHWTGSTNSPATFGHFGRSGSFLWVDPDAGLACAVLAGVDFGPWAAAAWPALSDSVLAAYPLRSGRSES